MAIDSISSSTTAGSIAAAQKVPEAQEPKGQPDRDGDSDDAGGGIQSIKPSVNNLGQAIGNTISVRA
jgi:hypothetical protein